MTESLKSEGDSISIDYLLHELERDIEDLDYHVDKFATQRTNVLEAQKRALAEYDAEMARIDEKYNQQHHSHDHEEANSRKPQKVDHNILKHLHIDRQSQYLAQQEEEEKKYEQEQYEEQETTSPKAPKLTYPTQNKNLSEQYLLEHSIPMLNFEEKKNSREGMFHFMEEATIEQTRLELELEEAIKQGDVKLEQELSEALLVLQCLHCEKLNDMVSLYRPLPFTKTFNSDPQYFQLIRQLKTITETYQVAEGSLPEVSGTIGGGHHHKQQQQRHKKK